MASGKTPDCKGADTQTGVLQWRVVLSSTGVCYLFTSHRLVTRTVNDWIGGH